MGEMLRSDPMTYCDMFLQPEAAFEIISQLGEMGCVEFTDMNPEVQAFQRRYISEVCRCAEMERRLRFMETEMLKDKIYMPYPKDEPKPMHPNEMVAFENIFEKWEEDITEMSINQSNLMKNYLEMTEMYYVLTHIGPILGDAEIQKDSMFTNRRKGQGDIGSSGRLFVMTGVVQRKKMFHFEMMLWRISRGNIYYRPASEDKILLDPVTGTEIRKVAFLTVCQGEELCTRVEKVFSGFRVNIYPCPQTLDEREEMMVKIDGRISDLEQVLNTSKYHRCKALRTVGAHWRSWMIQVRKAKANYHHMNLFTLDITKKCLIGQCWVPDSDLQEIQDMLETCSNMIGTNVPSFLLKTRTDTVPPTFHRTNKFTHGFQALINAYGDSKYGELNPGLYTVITFPFLFALMFGDIGHAFIIIIFATWMVKNEKQFLAEHSTNEIWNIFFGGRYVILLLGLFSMYTGFIYNDLFSKTTSITNSYYLNSFSGEEILKAEFLDLDPGGKITQPYIFGVDPVWKLASNKIMMDNMIKMKMSIIIGVTHMIFGICLSFFNYRHFKTYYLIFLQFIPEVVFLSFLFLWLVILIYYKWFTYGARHEDFQHQPGCAPQILILFIDMVLFKKTENEDKESECEPYMFTGQRELQQALVLIALTCIPVMLLGTPIYVNRLNKKKSRLAGGSRKIENFRRYQRSDSDSKPEETHDTSIVPFSELMINQAVHTIEFVLSTISHTASYLRLWALSLAHAQLSEMLWHMVLSKLALHDHSAMGIPKLFVIFSIWATFTICILVVMEGLSAFLHTLRLHWVEFMSKFYHGGGHPFKPFSYKALLSMDGEKPEGACKVKEKKIEVV